MSSPHTSAPTAPPSSTAGLSDLNTDFSAAVHRDLYLVPQDPAAERKLLTQQSRVLAMGFFVFFTLIIGGISMLFNGVHKSGFGAAFPRQANEVLPGEEHEGSHERGEAEAKLFKANPPEFQLKDADAGAWKAVDKIDLSYTDQDDVSKEDRKGLTAIQVYKKRTHVATCYVELEKGSKLGQLRLPNQEPAPLRRMPAHAFFNAKLFGLLPTRYLMAVGAVFGVLGLLVPGLLIPFYNFWMAKVTAPLGWFNTRLIMGIVFYGMFAPFAFFLRFKRMLSPQSDALRRSPNPPEQSYWIERKSRDHKHFQHPH